MEAFMRCTLAGLVPNDELAKDVFAKVKIGEVVRCDIKKPRDKRSAQQNRLYWKLMQLVLDNTDGQFSNREEVSNFLKIQAGHCEQRHIKLHGEKVLWLIPRSIAFDKMGHAEFQEYWKNALKIISERIIPLAPEELEAEVFSVLGEAA